jgi:hypothetical protein
MYAPRRSSQPASTASATADNNVSMSYSDMVVVMPGWLSHTMGMAINNQTNVCLHMKKNGKLKKIVCKCATFLKRMFLHKLLSPKYYTIFSIKSTFFPNISIFYCMLIVASFPALYCNAAVVK